MSSVHSDRLERWLGTETVEKLSQNMQGWHGPPILVGQVPGEVYVTAGGDFVGELKGGQHVSQFEYYLEKYYKWLNKLYTSSKSTLQMAGFASLSDLISEATAGAKRQELIFLKTGATTVAASTSTLWRVAGQPASGVSASSAPGGDICGSGTRGGMVFAPTSGSDTLHLVSANLIASVISTTLFYDRLFQVQKVMSSSANEAITGVPTRYQSTTNGAADSIEGNFLFIETTTTLGAVSHTWNISYQNHNDVSGSTTTAGNASNALWRLDMPASNWFVPLAAGDRGLKNLTQISCSTNTLTGGVDFVIGHPIVWSTNPVANVCSVMDGVNGALSLTRIFNNACLAMLEVNKSATTATIYSGSLVCVAG